MNLKSTKGDSKLITIYWFAILFIIAAGIVYITFNFYGKPYDIRKEEASLLLNKASDCFSKGGYLEEGFLGKLADFDTCRFNFNSEFGNDEYYLEVKIFNFDSLSLLKTYSKGNEALTIGCEIPSEKNPVCINEAFFSIDRSKNKYKIEITSIVRKIE